MIKVMAHPDFELKSWFQFIISEHSIGCADTCFRIAVNAADQKRATKRLRKYLENHYEDQITLAPHIEPGRMRADLHRNGGHLVIFRQ